MNNENDIKKKKLVGMYLIFTVLTITILVITMLFFLNTRCYGESHIASIINECTTKNLLIERIIGCVLGIILLVFLILSFVFSILILKRKYDKPVIACKVLPVISVITGSITIILTLLIIIPKILNLLGIIEQTTYL